MSYARFSYADVYVFMSTSGHLECCGCILGDQWAYDSTQAMVDHLAEHRAAGHDVPDGIEQQLRQDDRKNWTDPALIRATDDPDERGDFPCCADRAHKESLGGDSESGTYNRSNRPPAGPCTDERTTPAPVSGAGLDLDASHVRTDPACTFHDGTTPPASRGKRCPACMRLDLDALHETICDNFTGMAEVRQAADLLVSEVRRLTEESEARRVREMDAVDIATTPAPVGAAVELDLDAARAMLNAANTIKATGGAVEIGGVRIEPCDEYGSTVTTARAESAEAEVGTLRDTLARRTDSHTQLVRENEALRAKVAEGRRIVGMLAEAVESECEDDPEMCHEHDRTDDGRCPLLVDLNRAHAALATGEGK